MLTFLSLNVNGLRDQSKRAGLMQWLQSLSVVPDVVCLQESHCVSVEECHSRFLSSSFSFVSSPGTDKSCGCIILFCPCLSLISSRSDASGRLIACDFSLRDVIFRVVCVYAPNGNPHRDSFLDEISEWMRPAVPTTLAGYFCASVTSDASRESSVALACVFGDACCLDIWRYLHPSARGFTWSRADGLVSSRIDLFACPYVWVASASSCDIIPYPFSDHCALAFSVDPLSVTPPEPGLWKFNSSVLQDADYCLNINNFWIEWRLRKHDFPSLAKWWDAGKSKIKGLTISHCVHHSQKSSSSRTLLSRLANHLKERLDSSMTSCLGRYQSVLGRLEQIDLEGAWGVEVRSSIKWVEEGEVSSVFFRRLEKKRPVDRWVSALPLPDGSVVSDPDYLCSSFFEFYSSLYSASETDASAQETLVANFADSSLLNCRICAKVPLPWRNVIKPWLACPRGRPRGRIVLLRNLHGNFGMLWGLTLCKF